MLERPLSRFEPPAEPLVTPICAELPRRAVRGNGFGLVGDAAIGIVGALIGDWLLHRLGIHFSSGIIGLIINATIGAIVLLLALRLTGAGGWGGRWPVIVAGDTKASPLLGETLKVLERPNDSVVVNLLAVSQADRPGVFFRFLSAIGELRARTGRPHWIVVDEAHHVLPADRDASVTALPATLPPIVFVTVDPEALARDALEGVDDVLALGRKARHRSTGPLHPTESPPCPSH